MIELIANTTSETGLTISIPKTRYLSTKDLYNSVENKIERVEKLKHLEYLIDAKDGATSELQGKISKAWSVFGQLHIPLWTKREMNLVTKLRI